MGFSHSKYKKTLRGLKRRTSLGLAATQRKSLTVTVRKKGIRSTSSMTRRITSEMVEIGEGQKRIEEGQKEVRGKLKEIRKESKKLKHETELITKQSAANQLRLDLMFQIVKARAENDSANDARLTQTLRYYSMDNHAKRDGHLLGSSQQQKGKKRKSDGELANDLKKMKEGLKQDLKNLDKEIAQLSNIVENQENLMDDLLHQLQLGYEELEQLKEKFAILCPGPNWDAYMSETEEPVDIISLLKYRSQMLDRRIQLLYEMVFKLL